MEAGAVLAAGRPGAPPPRQLNPRVDAQLNALILRMLSLRPEERGSARELAEAMERGVAHGGPSADAPLFEWETLRHSRWTQEERAEAEYLGHRPRHRYRERVLEAEQADATARAQVERREAAQAPAPTQERARRWLPWLAAAMALGLWPEEPVRAVLRLSSRRSTAWPRLSASCLTRGHRTEHFG